MMQRFDSAPVRAVDSGFPLAQSGLLSSGEHAETGTSGEKRCPADRLAAFEL